MQDPKVDGAKVGDTIEIISHVPFLKSLSGRHFVVVPDRRIKIHTVESMPGDAWVCFGLGVGVAILLRFWEYEIISRSEAKQDTKSVDASLRKQLNDNLGGVFG